MGSFRASFRPTRASAFLGTRFNGVVEVVDPSVLHAIGGFYVLTGGSVTLKASVLPLTAGSGDYALTGGDANLLVGSLLSAGFGDYVIDGQPVDLVVTAAPPPAGHYVLDAGSGEYLIEGSDMVTLINLTLVAGSADYTITGGDADLTVHKALTWTPAELTGLAAWYKADGGVTTSGGNVTAVADQSGNGHNLTPTGTVALASNAINGHPAFDFNGSSALSTAMDLTGTGQSASVFILATLRGAAASWVELSAYAAFGDAWQNLGNALFFQRFFGNQEITSVTGGTNTAGNAITYDAPTNFGVIVNGPATVFQTFIDNVAGGTQYMPTYRWNTPGTYILGGGYNGGAISPTWNGYIAEAIIINGVVSDADRAAIADYFKTKYGLV